MSGPTTIGAALASRRERLATARLYLVCESRPGGRDPRPMLEAALAGGVDIIQLREPAGTPDSEIVAAARWFREAADAHGALFVINDRPDLVAACEADGVHVGQDDTPVGEARRIAGPEAIVGLSTHTPEQLAAARGAAAAERPDQISVGPIWATPTKPGRPATGLDLIRAAAASEEPGDPPWFAIGGIDTANMAEVTTAGAGRAVIVRAIRDAGSPEDAARELRAALVAVPLGDRP